MNKSASPLAGLVVAFFRGVVRVQEIFATGAKRERLRAVREKMTQIEADRDATLKTIADAEIDPRAAVDAIDAFKQRHGLPSDTATQEKLRALRRDSAALQEIVARAGNDHRAAADGIRAFLCVNPASALAYTKLSAVLRARGDFDDSIAACREAIAIEGIQTPGIVPVRVQIAQLLHEKGDRDAAVAEFSRIIDDARANDDPMLCVAFFEFGNLLEATGDASGARTAWRQALAHDPGDFIRAQVERKLA